VRAVPTHAVPSTRLTISTGARVELVDITDQIAAVVGSSGLADGTVHLWCPHTSCGLAVTEDEEGLHEDLGAVLEELAPQARPWIHDDLSRRWQNVVPGERPNGDSHIRALLATTPSLCVPIASEQLGIGRWQRIFVVELDGPRDRTVVVQSWGIPTSVSTPPEAELPAGTPEDG